MCVWQVIDIFIVALHFEKNQARNFSNWVKRTVTRLGEVSPLSLGNFFLLDSFSKLTEVAHIFRAYIFLVKSCALIMARRSLATFWAIFSQTRLVALTQAQCGRQQLSQLSFFSALWYRTRCKIMKTF
jgi:hypothetical protein